MSSASRLSLAQAFDEAAVLLGLDAHADGAVGAGAAAAQPFAEMPAAASMPLLASFASAASLPAILVRGPTEKPIVAVELVDLADEVAVQLSTLSLGAN